PHGSMPRFQTLLSNSCKLHPSTWTRKSCPCPSASAPRASQEQVGPLPLRRRPFRLSPSGIRLSRSSNQAVPSLLRPPPLSLPAWPRPSRFDPSFDGLAVHHGALTSAGSLLSSSSVLRATASSRSRNPADLAGKIPQTSRPSRRHYTCSSDEHWAS